MCVCVWTVEHRGNLSHHTLKENYYCQTFSIILLLFCRESSEKHLHPVWQVTWIKQEMRSSGEERAEALVSVSADGRITKWFLCSNGLESIGTLLFQNIKDSWQD